MAFDDYDSFSPQNCDKLKRPRKWLNTFIICFLEVDPFSRCNNFTHFAVQKISFSQCQDGTHCAVQKHFSFYIEDVKKHKWMQIETDFERLRSEILAELDWK